MHFHNGAGCLELRESCGRIAHIILACEINTHHPVCSSRWNVGIQGNVLNVCEHGTDMSSQNNVLIDRPKVKFCDDHHIAFTRSALEFETGKEGLACARRYTLWSSQLC